MSEKTKTIEINEEKLDEIINPQKNKEMKEEFGINKDDFDYLISIKDENVRKNVAQILKNSMDSSEVFKIISKLILKIFPNLTSNDLFSVKPSETPVSQAFVLRWMNDITDITDDKICIVGDGGSFKFINKIFTIGTKKMRTEIKDIDNIDINFLSNQIKNEIDKELVDRAIELGNKNMMNIINIENDKKSINERYGDIYYQIIQGSNFIGHSSKRGRANNIVVSYSVARMMCLLNKIDNFDLDKLNNIEMDNGYVFLGNIEKGLIRVWLNTYFKEDDYCLGHVLFIYKGKMSFDTGIVYSPYALLIMKTIKSENNIGMINSEDFHPNPFITEDNKKENTVYFFGLRDTIISNYPGTEKYYGCMKIVK